MAKRCHSWEIIERFSTGSDVRYVKTLAATLFPGRILGTIPDFFERHLKAHPDSGYTEVSFKALRTVPARCYADPGKKSLPNPVSKAHASVHFREGYLEKYPEANRYNMQSS